MNMKHNTRRDRRRFMPALPHTASLAAFALLLFAGCAPKPVAPKNVELDVASNGDFLEFTPDTLTCPAGAHVRLTFHHGGKILSARHDWVLTRADQLDSLTKDALDTDGKLAPNDPRIIARTQLADKGETVTTDFVAPPPGDYPFLCSTHPEDMRGILHVTK